MSHQPQDVETKLNLYYTLPKPKDHNKLLMRISCSCGWKGCWYEDGDFAERSFERHVAQKASA